jgi:peptide/nickel transport system substrate-binding protein
MDSVKACGKSGYYFWNHPQMPTISAYITMNEKNDPLVKMVRNPYYWKVDAEGNQLPYIDEIDFLIVNNSDQAILMLESNDSDVDYIVANIKDVIAIEDAMGDGVERHELTSTYWGDGQLYFNLTDKNLEIRELVNNKSFRIALSVAVDREQVVNLWYDGLTEPANSAPEYPNFGYNEEWSKRYTQYDPEYAKKLLTEDCGLTMGSDGWFYYPSGNKVVLTAVSGTSTSDAERFAVLKQYWDAIGIEINLNQVDNSGVYFDSNEGWDISWGEKDISGYKIESRPKQFIPLNLAATWYSFYDTRGSAYNPEFFDLDGDLLKLYNVYQEWLQIPELTDRDEKELEMMQILIDNTWWLAFSTFPSEYYMVRTGIGNWPESMLNEDKFNFQMQFGFNTMYFK